MRWAKWTDDIPYEAPTMEKKARNKWMTGTVALLVSGFLGLIGWLMALGEDPAALLSRKMGVGSVAVWGIIILLHLFRLACYAAWRRGKSIKWVYRWGQVACLALILPVGLWALSGMFKEEPPKSAVLGAYSYQTSPLAAMAWGNGKGYEYRIVEVKAPFVYDLCLDAYTRERVTLYSGDWERWPAVLGAKALYERWEGRYWLAFWDDRIVWVSFNEAPEDDGGTVMETLETLRAWEG